MRRQVESVHSEDQSVNSVDSSEMEYNDQSEHYEPYYKKRRVDEYEHAEECSEEEECSEIDVSESERETEGNEESDKEEEEEDQSSSDLEDYTVYQDWLQEAKDETENMWNVKYEKYTIEGMIEDDAREKANTKALWAVKRNFSARFKARGGEWL